MAAISPTKTTSKYIKSFMAYIFWVVKRKRKNTMGITEPLGYPNDERGIRMRLLEDICMSFQYTQLWNLELHNLFVGNFSNPNIVKDLLWWIKNMIQGSHWFGGILLEIERM